MRWLSFFTRPKVSMDGSAPFTHIPGTTFPAQAESFGYVPERADPTFLTGVFSGPRFHYEPLTVVATEPQVWQDLNLPTSPPQGYIYEGFGTAELMSSDDYPDVPLDIG